MRHFAIAGPKADSWDIQSPSFSYIIKSSDAMPKAEIY
jgi:hypothetical protein